MLRSAPRKVPTRTACSASAVASRVPRSQPRLLLSVPKNGSSHVVALRRPPGQRWRSTFRATKSFGPQFDFAAASFSHLGIAAALGLLVWVSSDTASAEENEKSTKRADDDEADAEAEPPALEAKYLIIGSGTAAYSAIKELKSIDPNAKIVVISEEFYLPYQRPPLTKELWRTADPNVAANLTFTDWQDAFFSPANNVFFIRVDGNILLSPERHMVQLPDGGTIKYEKALIATGAKPFARFPGDWTLGDAVTTYRNLEDFQGLYSQVKEGGKTIAIAGGGFLGSELAWAISRFEAKAKNEIIQIVPESGLMANLFPKYLSDYVTDKLRNAGVNIMTGRLVKEITHADGKVNIKLDNDTSVAADHLVLAAGVIPDTRVASFCELELDPVSRGIVANSELQAGDVASYFDFFLGRRRVEHYDHAVESGKLAAQNMAGAKKPYTHIPMFWGELGSEAYEAVGNIDSRLRTVAVWETPDGNAPHKPEFRKGSIYYLNKDNRVAGVLLWNMFGKADNARAVIRRYKQYENMDDLTWAIDFEEKH